MFRTRHGYEQGTSKPGNSSTSEGLRSDVGKAGRRQLGRERVLCSKALPWALPVTAQDDEMLWRFMENDEIALTNNEAERALRGYVLWRKEIWRLVASGRAVQATLAILSLVGDGQRWAAARRNG